MSDQNEMEKIETPIMEHLCDHLYWFPWETVRKEELEDICTECKINRYTNDILNTYCRDREWIPVTEPFPEPGKMILLTIEYEQFDV